MCLYPSFNDHVSDWVLGTVGGAEGRECMKPSRAYSRRLLDLTCVLVRGIMVEEELSAQPFVLPGSPQNGRHGEAHSQVMQF